MGTNENCPRHHKSGKEKTEGKNMKALSVHQPWASQIAAGSKTIETRTWPTSYRGDLLIVSTMSPKIMGCPLGQALCIVRLVDSRPMTLDDELAARCRWFNGAFAWVLDDLRPIVPFRVKGQLGIYDVPLEDE